MTARKGTITFGLLKWVKFPCPSNRSGRYHSSWVSGPEGGSIASRCSQCRGSQCGHLCQGGGADQNPIMLDDAVVYNTGHLFRFFSIFNSDAIKNVSLIKGGMPAQYGGRLSSVLDISMKEEICRRHRWKGIGLIASRLSVQGPIKRQGFVHRIGQAHLCGCFKQTIYQQEQPVLRVGYYFYDLNAKVNYKFSDKDRLYLSGYFGRDVFDFEWQAEPGCEDTWVMPRAPFAGTTYSTANSS